VYLSQLLWQDGLDGEETSLPPPSLSPLIPSYFNTSISEWTFDQGEWVETPTGLQVGYVLSPERGAERERERGREREREGERGRERERERERERGRVRERG
jgi:hypothetical protein